MCVHVHEGARVFESTHAWMCTWVTEVTLEHLLSTLFVVVCCLFGDGVSRWTWNLAISLTGRLVNPGYPPVSTFPILGLQVVTTMSGCQAKDFTSWTISPPLFDNNLVDYFKIARRGARNKQTDKKKTKKNHDTYVKGWWTCQLPGLIDTCCTPALKCLLT